MLDLFLILAGAYVYRMRGGMKPSFPRPIDQLIFALPYGIYTWYVWYYQMDLRWEYALPLSIAVWGITAAAVAKGHGNSMDLGEYDREPEWYEFAIRWLKPHMPLYWYDALGCAISGLTYTLVPGLVTLNPVLALSGLLKGPAYMIAKKAEARTEGGELLTGAALWGIF